MGRPVPGLPAAARLHQRWPLSSAAACFMRVSFGMCFISTRTSSIVYKISVHFQKHFSFRSDHIYHIIPNMLNLINNIPTDWALSDYLQQKIIRYLFIFSEHHILFTISSNGKGFLSPTPYSPSMTALHCILQHDFQHLDNPLCNASSSARYPSVPLPSVLRLKTLNLSVRLQKCAREVILHV